MFHIPKVLPEEEYRKQWEAGQHQSDYNACRFAEDKLEYGKQWFRRYAPWINFDNPKNIADRIANCKLYDMNPLKPKWADKICSHWNLYEAGMEELAIEPVYFTRCYLTDYDWSYNIKNAVPQGKYILKMNHGSGWNMRFTLTDDFDPTYMQQKVWEWYNLNFACIAGWEWHYDKIQPGFVIQPDFGELMNWEFWCEEGKIAAVNLVRKVNKNREDNVAWVDENGNMPPFIITRPSQLFLSKSQKEILEKMKPYVKKLAEPFKFVRVDLYSINGEPKFSELTFTPCAGRIRLGA